MKRRLVCTLSLLTASIILGYVFFVGWLSGFLITKYMAGKTSGKAGRIKSIVIPFRKYKIHFHHWLISSGIIILILLTNVGFLASAIACGVLSGSVFHGIYSYDDWHKILIPRRHQAIKNTSVYNTEHLLTKG